MPGPGYATPLDAYKYGPKEKVLYVTCPRVDSDKPDQLCTLDVDPSSKTYGKNPKAQRSHLVLPCLNTSRIYVANVTNERLPRWDKIIEPSELFAHDVSFGHTSHCLANGNVMISTLGDKNDNGKGSFLLLDSKTFEVKGTWGDKSVPWGYDYWYQPYFNLMISTSWGSPKAIKSGFNLDHVKNGEYGHELYVWKWKEETLSEVLKLDPVKGMMPLEIRFFHDPKSIHGFVGCALGSTIYHLHWDEKRQKLNADLVVELPTLKVKGWILPEMPALITDILVSLDDRYLYVSCWLHGELLQFDITNPAKPKLVGKVQIGGAVRGGVTLADGSQPAPTIIQGRQVFGGSQMLQLSLDGKRMYVTTSLYTQWDKQFYPELTHDEFGPVQCHEMRYPGGDCSSDIWLAECCSAGPKM